jgi:hypothetical protein
MGRKRFVVARTGDAITAEDAQDAEDIDRRSIRDRSAGSASHRFRGSARERQQLRAFLCVLGGLRGETNRVQAAYRAAHVRR